MTTLAQYKTAVTARGYDAVTSAPAILEAINAARRDIFTRRRWSFLEANNAALVTVANVATVSLAAITDLLHVDAVRVTDGTAGVPVSYKPPQEFKDLAHTYRDPSEPAYWTEYGGTLRFWPTPSKAYTLSVDYVTSPADLASDADTCPIPSKDQDAVGWGAAKLLAYRQRDPNLMQLAEAQFERAVLRAMSNDKRSQRQTPTRIRASGLYS